MAPSQRNSRAARAVGLLTSAVLAVLLVAGLAAVAVGGWFISAIGVSGAAEFTTTPDQATVLVLGPDVLARTDTPVTITVHASGDTALWAGLARPSDAAAAVGSSQRSTVTGVTLDGWRAVTAQSGTAPAEAVSAGDVWTRTVTGDGDLALTVARSQGAQTLVITGADGAPVPVEELSLTWENGNWFFQALLLVVVGLILAVTAAWLLVRRIRRDLDRRRAANGHPPTTEDTDADPSDADTDTGDATSDADTDTKEELRT